MIALAALVLWQIPPAEPPFAAADEVSYLPGQLEVVTGPRAVPTTIMSLYFQTETQPKFMQNAIIGQALIAYNFGWVRFSTTSEDFLGLKVWHMSWVGHTNAHHGKKEYPEDAKTDYWVDMDGHIRRQSASKSNMFGHAEALCDYFPDHIQVQTKKDGKYLEQFLYPAHDELAQLNDQFKPMMLDGKIILREKEYIVLDPYGCSFQHRTARVHGHFSGKELDTKFQGYNIDIETDHKIQGACVSDDNDLVRVNLQDDKWIVMQTLPPNRQK
jgi:hypothetical protein